VRRQRRRGVHCHDHINLEPDKLGRELRKPIQLSFRGAKLERDVLALHVAEFTQSFAKIGLERLLVRGSDIERAYTCEFGLLSPRRERPRGSAAEQRDERASFHSITSLAPQSYRRRRVIGHICRSNVRFVPAWPSASAPLGTSRSRCGT